MHHCPSRIQDNLERIVLMKIDQIKINKTTATFRKGSPSYVLRLQYSDPKVERRVVVLSVNEPATSIKLF